MRKLTAKQKKLLKEWFTKNYKGDCKFNLADNIDSETYDKIDSINYTEMFYPNANNYLEDLANNYNK